MDGNERKRIHGKKSMRQEGWSEEERRTRKVKSDAKENKKRKEDWRGFLSVRIPSSST